ncbi:hypothetical protein QUA82_27405 [Microcoleus sp. F8-D3]
MSKLDRGRQEKCDRLGARSPTSNLKYQAACELPERNHTIRLLKNLTLMCRSYSRTRTILC